MCQDSECGNTNMLGYYGTQRLFRSKFLLALVFNFLNLCLLGGENVGISYCHGLGGNQVFAYTKRQQIMSDDNCLDATGTDGIVKLIRCHGMGGNQAWLYEAQVFFEQYYKKYR